MRSASLRGTTALTTRTRGFLSSPPPSPTHRRKLEACESSGTHDRKEPHPLPFTAFFVFVLPLLAFVLGAAIPRLPDPPVLMRQAHRSPRFGINQENRVDPKPSSLSAF